MGLIANIVTEIEAQVVTATTYAKSSYYYNIAQDKRNGAIKKFSVLPRSALENDYVLGSYAVDHTFEIALTDTYKSSKLKNDYDLVGKVIVLQDLLHDTFKQVKCNSIGTAGILNVFDFQISEPEIDEDNHIILQKMTILVKYKNNLT